jgi:hypothetical protein
MIVCGIIAMLLALTFSAVNSARAMALRTERANWHRQRLLGEVVPRGLPIKVLFIGNSYTSTNDLPGMLLALSEAAGARPPLIVESHTVGGAKLKDHWDGGVALEKIRSDEWDLVVLQEQSQTCLPQFGGKQLFYPYVKRFDAEIRRQQAIPMLFMTWARADTPGPQAWWTEAYVDAAKRLSDDCCPAGMAMQKALQGLPHIALHQDSGGHPTPAATYLVACTFFAAIYGRPPKLPATVTYGSGPVTLAPADAEAMQSYAWEALQEVKRRARPDWR